MFLLQFYRIMVGFFLAQVILKFYCYWNIVLTVLAAVLIYESCFIPITWKLKLETGTEASTESLFPGYGLLRQRK